MARPSTPVIRNIVDRPPKPMFGAGLGAGEAFQLQWGRLKPPARFAISESEHRRLCSLIQARDRSGATTAPDFAGVIDALLPVAGRDVTFRRMGHDETMTHKASQMHLAVTHCPHTARRSKES